MSTKCAPGVPDADFADLVHTRLSLSQASWGGQWASTRLTRLAQADVVEPAAGARPPVFVAFSQRKELPLTASQRAVIPRGDERQPKRLEATSTEPSL
jgi:hypothetical protein